MDRYSKKWVFTYNTKDAQEANSRAAALAVTAHIETFAQNECDWLIVELEQGGLEQRWHLQGAFVLKQKKRGTTLVNSYFPRMHFHFEEMRGTAQDSYDYCTKWHKDHPDDYLFEHGERPTTTRTKHLDIKDALELYSTEREFRQEQPHLFSRYLPTVRAHYAEIEAHNHTKRDVHITWMYGQTATGKSFSAEPYMQQLLTHKGHDQ